MKQTAAPQFSWLVIDQDSTAVLKLRGELDMAAIEKTGDALLEDVEGCDASLVIDTAELDFIDSTGLRLLLEIRFRLDRAGRGVTLGPASRTVERVLEISGIRRVFESGDRHSARR